MALLSIFTADHPMMSAATTLMSHAGDSVASHTPKGDVTAPPMPAARPSDGMHVLCRICDTAPEMDVGIMANREVAVDMMALISNSRRKTGTMTVPPPMPSSPDRMPMPMPTIAGMTNAVIGSMNLPASPDSNHGRRTQCSGNLDAHRYEIRQF